MTCLPAAFRCARTRAVVGPLGVRSLELRCDRAGTTVRLYLALS